MKLFFIALLFGVLQSFLLKNLLFSITAGKTGKIVGIFLLKFVCYGIAAALLISLFFKDITYALCGFAVGMPLSAIALFVYYAYIKDNPKLKGKWR